MLRFVCDKCGGVINSQKAYRRVEVYTLAGVPDISTVPGDLLELKTTFDLCSRCFKKLDLE